jgi:hypothetical protein
MGLEQLSVTGVSRGIGDRQDVNWIAKRSHVEVDRAAALVSV